MGNDTSDSQKDDPVDEGLSLDLKSDENLSGESGLLKLGNQLRQQSLQHTFVSNGGKKLEIVKNGFKASFSRGARFLDSKIPRHVVSLDEKYLRRCLELIHISASKSARCDISVNFVGSLKMGISPYHRDSPVTSKENTCNLAQFVFEFPLVDGSGSAVTGSTITGYKSIVHILDRPLFRKLGAMDVGPNTRRTLQENVKGSISCDIVSSPSHSPLKMGAKDKVDSRVQKYLSENMYKRVVSVSSTNSTCSSSEHSFSSAPTTVSHGTLLFTMKENGLPHFVFSLDDKKEVYLASLSNAESGFDNNELDYSYLIHLQKGSGAESHLVGKIEVSTLFTVSSSNSKIMEREFVLFSGGGQIPCQDIRKNKGLPKKVVDAFKNSRASRQRSISRLSKTSSIPDFCSWEPFQEPNYDLEPINLLEDNLPPNIESAAVVVREHCPEEQREEEVGGWGMKFLKKASLARTHDTSEPLKPSTSVDVVIPAGIHGGPRTRNSGLSSLIQRWKSGGSCDCGGWDLGCPITVLKGQPPKDQSEGQCNLFELFTEGFRQGTPGLRIVNVHDGLYFLQFQSKITVLQSFSIAVAYIHSQSSRLRPVAGNCTEA